MGRNQSRNNKGRGKGRGNSNRRQASSSSTTTTKKTLEDYKYDIGSSKNASEYVSTTKFLISRIATTYEEADDIATALTQGKEFDLSAHRPSLEVSVVPGTEPAAVAKREKENREFEMIFNKESEAFIQRQNQYRQNKPKAAALIMSRCTDRLKTKLHQRSDWETIEKDPVELLAAIKQHAMNYEATQYKMKTLCDALKNVLNLKQKDDESLTDYLKRSKASIDVFYSHAGKRFSFPRTVEQSKEYQKIKDDLDKAIIAGNEIEYNKAMKDLKDLEHKITDEFLGFLFMENSDRSKYGTLLSGLETQHSLGNDQYPKTLVDAHTVLANHNFDQEYYKNRDRRRGDRSNRRDGGNGNQLLPLQNFLLLKKRLVRCLCHLRGKVVSNGPQG